MPVRGEAGGTVRAPARAHFGLALIAAATLCLGGVQAQPSAPAAKPTPRWPTPQEIERARSERPLPPVNTLPGEARPLPRIGTTRPNPSAGGPAPAPGLDIAALARQGGALAGGASVTGQTIPAPALHIFVTLDMPSGSLQRLVDQAEKTGATLVLRGLKNQSMRQTLAAVSGLLGRRRVGWLIDPEAFERHGIQTAPTFVLTLGDEPASGAGAAPACSATTCTAPRAFVSVSGDVTLDYALDFIARSRPGAAPVAGPYLAKLRPR